MTNDTNVVTLRLPSVALLLQTHAVLIINKCEKFDSLKFTGWVSLCSKQQV